MDKTQIYNRAIADYQSGSLSWHDLKRKYRELSTREIFTEVIAKSRCSTNKKKE